MSAIMESIDISRNPEDAFSYVTDPSRLPEWQEGVVSVRPVGDARLAVGSRVVVTRRIGRREIPMTSEVTELDPPRSWRIRQSESQEPGAAPRPRCSQARTHPHASRTAYGIRAARIDHGVEAVPLTDIPTVGPPSGRRGSRDDGGDGGDGDGGDGA